MEDTLVFLVGGRRTNPLLKYAEQCLGFEGIGHGMHASMKSRVSFKSCFCDLDYEYVVNLELFIRH